MRADEEANVHVAPADTEVRNGKVVEDRVLCRYRNDVLWVTPTSIEYIDLIPEQMVGSLPSLIPFLEHDDANRALMGSNMQRQAVPLLNAERPLVGTGMEKSVAENSGMVVRAEAGRKSDLR